MANLTLYDYPLSGNCHKIRLLLSLMDLGHRIEPVDILGDGARTKAFLKLNPRGQVPVLTDGETVIWDSMAILTYLARQYGESHWLPGEPLALTRVMQWLAVSENELLYGIARARAVLKLGRPFNLEDCQALGRKALALMDDHLGNRDWLATDGSPSIADIACYPYIALASEGGIALAPYPNVRRWLGRIQVLPGYIGMPGMADYA